VLIRYKKPPPKWKKPLLWDSSEGFEQGKLRAALLGLIAAIAVK
jgi:hypothetical protein